MTIPPPSHAQRAPWRRRRLRRLINKRTHELATFYAARWRVQIELALAEGKLSPHLIQFWEPR